jgi:hypothetical protein
VSGRWVAVTEQGGCEAAVATSKLAGGYFRARV